MKRCWSELILAAGLAALSGCVTLTFKPGASPETMAADERACRESAGEAGFVECMRTKGWYVKEGAATPSPVTTATEAPRAADTSPTAPADAPPLPKAPPSAPAAAIVPTPLPAAAATAATARMPTASPTAETAEPALIAPASSGSLPRVRVGSWWKLGGTAAGLDSAIAACVTKLGAPHQPDPNATVVTVALRDCLRADGWYAYDESAVP